MLTIALPTTEEMLVLEPFEGMALDRIYVPFTEAEFQTAANRLCALPVVGFDTETRPSFVRGVESHGPHIIQLAAPDFAIIFQVFRQGCLAAVRRVLESEVTTKVGFGLSSDEAGLRRRLGVDLRAVIDLGTSLQCAEYKGNVGARVAVASVLNARLIKSRKVTTSNWAHATLTDKQLKYAADDAYAALMVFQALEEQMNLNQECVSQR